MKRLAVVVLLIAAACSPGEAEHRLIVAAGTTLVDSGLIDELAEIYEVWNPDVELSVVGEASAQILELGRRGGADVLITHAPELEADFLHEGLAARYELVLGSSFVLVGPPSASFASGDVIGVMQEIADRQGPFVSRADGSGTHETEIGLWQAAGIDPENEDWYAETGQGMGLTLQVADQRKAFTLAEVGAFLSAEDVLSLAAIPATGMPANPYHLTVVSTSDELDAGVGFLEWLLSDDGREAIEQTNLDLFGRTVYQPAG